MSGNNGLMDGRTLYIPRLSIDGASALAAAYRSVGINAQLAPASDAQSNALARQYTLGEECYPQIVTLGSFLKIIQYPEFDVQKTAFLMPTTGGPCRFGQYRPLIEKILNERGLGEIPVISPSSIDGYDEIGGQGSDLLRIGWWAIVCSDALRKLLLQTRPYEKNPGETDHTHAESLNLLCKLLERQDLKSKDKFKQLVHTMSEIAFAFSKIPADYSNSKPLIGVVGEIYCRMDGFANAGFIKKIEKFGGEVWLAPVSEWVWYTNV
jgi:predicted nucleotide-binding protein (sugar kinase/HSP70/actin superfamily)